MNEEELTKHDAYYGAIPGYKDALFQALDAVGFIALESDMRDFTCKLWEKGFALSPVVNQEGGAE